MPPKRLVPRAQSTSVEAPVIKSPPSPATKRKQPVLVEVAQPEPVKRQRTPVNKNEVKETSRKISSTSPQQSVIKSTPQSQTVKQPQSTKSPPASLANSTKGKSAILFKAKAAQFSEEEEEEEEDANAHVVLPPPKKASSITKQPKTEPEFDLSTFATSPLVSETQKALKAMNITSLNALQKASLLPLLQGRDALIISGSNSGKTLTALLPALQLVIETGFDQRNFTGILLLTPTREKALLTYKMVTELTQFNSGITHGMLLGNTNPFIQFEKLQKGIGIVVATPQRALQHMQTKGAIWYKNIMSVIIDDCDVMNELGCDAKIIELTQGLDDLRHTICLSSSNTRAVQKIARATMNKPLLIGSKTTATNEVTGSIIDEKQFKDNNERNKEILKQAVAKFDQSNQGYIKNGYITIPTANRFNILYTVLKKTLLSKQVIFVQTPDEVAHLTALLRQFDIVSLGLHEQLKEQQRNKIFAEFQNATKGALLFVTELALRGLKFSSPVDSIYHYDIPVTPLRYLERLAHFPAIPTQDSSSPRLNSIVFILEENEIPLSEQFTSKLPFTAFSLPPIINIYGNVNKMIESNFFLHTSATKAFFAYMRYYIQYSSDGGQYDLKSINNIGIANSFGLEHPPGIKD